MFYRKANAKKVRVDLVAIIAVYVVAFISYAKFYPILLAFIILRGAVVSFMDNIYHYGTAADNSEAGKNLTLPRVFENLLLNSNYHETHHNNTQLSWSELRKFHSENGGEFAGSFIEHGLMQFKGPIIFEAQ